MFLQKRLHPAFGATGMRSKKDTVRAEMVEMSFINMT